MADLPGMGVVETESDQRLRLNPVLEHHPHAGADSGHTGWPHGLATQDGHTGWPHGTWAAWNLPPVFQWRHPTTGDEIIVMNEQGYGR